MAVKTGLFYLKLRQKTLKPREDSAFDKYFNWATSECEEKTSEPHHSENCDNVRSETDDVMPDSQMGSLRARSEVNHFKRVEFDKERCSSAGASDDSYEHKNSKLATTIWWKNDPTIWPDVMKWNFKGYLIQIRPPTITTEYLPETRVIGRF